MEQTIIQIGNSSGVIIPQKILKSAGVQSGDKVMVEVDGKKISISPIKEVAEGVDAHFMKMADTFIEEHKDVLEQLSKR